MMTEIYSQAHKVMVWLGPPTIDLELAMAKLEALKAYWFLVATNEVRGIESSIKQFPLKSSPVSWHKELPAAVVTVFGDPTRGSEACVEPWNAIFRFLENKWFTRAWIAQEVSSPFWDFTPNGNVEMIMGRQLQTISLKSCVDVLTWFLIIFFPSEWVRNSIRPWNEANEVLNKARRGNYAIDQLNKIRTFRRPCSLYPSSCLISKQRIWTQKVLSLLRIYRELEATDPHDILYAALPLVLPSNHSALNIDYEVSVKEAYASFAASAIRCCKSLDVLSGVSDHDDGMPSWVPDWRYPRQCDAMADKRYISGKCIYNACGDTKPATSIVHEPESWCLKSVGIIHDTITNLNPITRDQKHPISWTGRLLHLRF